jgi:hypothetical protein
MLSTYTYTSLIERLNVFLLCTLPSVVSVLGREEERRPTNNNNTFILIESCGKALEGNIGKIFVKMHSRLLARRGEGGRDVLRG